MPILLKTQQPPIFSYLVSCIDCQCWQPKNTTTRQINGFHAEMKNDGEAFLFGSVSVLFQFARPGGALRKGKICFFLLLLLGFSVPVLSSPRIRVLFMSRFVCVVWDFFCSLTHAYEECHRRGKFPDIAHSSKSLKNKNKRHTFTSPENLQMRIFSSFSLSSISFGFYIQPFRLLSEFPSTF